MINLFRIFFVCTILFWLAGCAAPPIVQPPPSVPKPVAAEPPPEPVIDYGALRLSVAGVGDIMSGTDFPENRLPDDDGINFFSQVAPILKSVDIAFGNFEGVLLDGGEPAKKCQNPNGIPTGGGVL